MDAAHFVEASEADEGGDVASHPTGALHSGSQVVTWYRHTWQIMIYFTIDHVLIWPAQGQEVSKHEWHIVQSPKMIIIIVWSPISFHVVDVLSKGSKFNDHHYVSAIL
jgi:hypothetical protein